MSDAPRADDSWFSRDLPVLVALVSRWDREGQVQSWDLAEDTGLDVELIGRAGTALRDAGYIDIQHFDQAAFIVQRISGEARRAAGSWPTAETFADRLLEAVERGLADAKTPEERSRWQKLKDGMTSAGRDLLINASGSAIGGALGG